MIRLKQAESFRGISRCISAILLLQLAVSLTTISAHASGEDITKSIEVTDDFTKNARLFRFDRFDAFRASVERYEKQTNINSLSSFVAGQKQQGILIPDLLKRHKQQGDEPFAAWVSGLLMHYPEQAYRLLSHLSEVNPYRKDEMGVALASYLQQRFGVFPDLKPASVPEVAATPLALGIIETDGLVFDDTAGLATGTAAAGAASSVSVTTVALYSVAGTFALAGSDITGSGSSCKVCGSGNTIMSQNPESFETTEYQAQVGLDAVKASSAYARGHNGAGVLVSVVDSPFQLDHPEFSGRLVEGYHVDDASYSADVCSDNTTTSCSRNHGTHVASTIVGARDNGTGMHGVAYNAKVKPVAFIAGSSSFTSTQLENMFAAASGMDNGSQIVAMNNSWGPEPELISTGIGTEVYVAPDVSDTALEALYHSWLSDAADNGTILVWAAGNDGWNSATGRVAIFDSAADYTADPNAPSRTVLASEFVDNTSFTSANQVDYLTKLPSLVDNASAYIIDQSKDQYRWINVVATDPENDNAIATFSNGCGDTRNYCMAAPGVGIYAAVDGSAYSDYQGTSMAAPHVSGAIAVLADMYPDLEPEEIVAILLRSATDLGANGVDAVYGHGLLNLEKATGPIGDINLATVTSGGGVSLLGNDVEIQSPAIMGNVLKNVNLALLDEYDRLYEVSVPVTAQLHDRLTLAQRMKQDGLKSEDVIAFAGGSLAFTVDNPEDVGAVSIEYQQQTQQGLLTTGYSSLGTSNDSVDETAAFSDAYSHYYLEPSIAQDMQQTAYLGLKHSNEMTGFGMSTNLRASHSETGSILQYSSGWSLTRGIFDAKLSIGGVAESARFMGAEMTGALALGDAGTKTVFARVDVAADLGPLGGLDLFYVAGRSDVDFAQPELVAMQNIQHDSYGAQLSKKFGDNSDRQLQARLWRPLALTSGELMINQITNYRRAGLVETRRSHYSLVPKRETAFSVDMLWNGLRAGLYHRMNMRHINELDETGGYITTSIRF